MTKIHRGSIKKRKGIIEEKYNVFKAYRNKCSNIILKNHLRKLQVRLNCSIERAKEKFDNTIVSKLNDTQKNAKAYWS